MSFFQTYFRELLRMMAPDFYAHLLLQDAAMDMLFCHRWLLLSFKREFFNEEVLKMWEACWSRYQTDYFHIFLCVAMVQEYGKTVLQQDMTADDMLQFFTDLSMKMDGTRVLRIARQLLLKFRQLPGIPCSLRGLLSGPGVWDSAPLPEIQCSCHDKCLYLFGDLEEHEGEKSERITGNEKLSTEKDNRSEHLVGDNSDVGKACLDLQQHIQIHQVHDERTCESPAQNIDDDEQDNSEVSSQMVKNITDDLRETKESTSLNANQDQLEQEALNEEQLKQNGPNQEQVEQQASNEKPPEQQDPNLDQLEKQPPLQDQLKQQRLNQHHVEKQAPNLYQPEKQAPKNQQQPEQHGPYQEQLEQSDSKDEKGVSNNS